MPIKVWRPKSDGRNSSRSPRLLEAADRTAAFHPSLSAAGYHIHGCYVVRLRTTLKNFVD
jgi:hypothetical protein